MSKPTISATIDKSHPKKDKARPNESVCALSIRITFLRKHRYFYTGIDLTVDEFKRYVTRFEKYQSRTEVENQLYKKIDAFRDKAIKIIDDKLPVFTFNKFEELYYQKRIATNDVIAAFDQYIHELTEEERIGTAVAYECARNSIEKFRKNNGYSPIKFADIDKKFLNAYEKWMLSENKSKTTVGIYLRSFRTIFNASEVDKSIYPFSTNSRKKDKNKYRIPEGRNIKKALSLEQISKIFNYPIEPGTTKEMARDYWVFIYLSNGINVKDMCLLKRKDIDGNLLTYIRSKTVNTKDEVSEIQVSLKPEAKIVIAKWGQPSLNPDSYIFPHLEKGMTPKRQREIVQQLTKTINKYMKIIAAELNIDRKCTTYYARHSFSTILKRSGASTEYISEALGHSDTGTTKRYLASFEEDTIHSTTDALTAFKIAN